MDFFEGMFGMDMNGDGKVDLMDALIFEDITREEAEDAEDEEELEAYLTTVEEEEYDNDDFF